METSHFYLVASNGNEPEKKEKEDPRIPVILISPEELFGNRKYRHSELGTYVMSLEDETRTDSVNYDTNNSKVKNSSQISAGNHIDYTYIDRLLIKKGEKFIFIELEEVDWIESSGNYITLNSNEDKYLVRSSLKRLEEKLDPSTFIRIHKSTIVNVKQVKKFEKWFSGDYNVFLKNGRELRMSRNYRENLDRFRIS